MTQRAGQHQPFESSGSGAARGRYQSLARRSSSLDTDEVSAQLEEGAGGSGGGTGGEGGVDWGIVAPAFLFPALGGALFGYDIGASGGALISLTSQATAGTDWYELSSFQSGAVVSASLLGALAGSAAAFVAGNRNSLGRRKELLLASVLYGVAAVTMYSAPSYEILLAGRLLYGLGIGFAMHAAPAYIAEVVPSSVRGLLISLKEAIIVCGVLAGYVGGALLQDEVGGWRTMFGAAAIPAVLLAGGMYWLMESPRFMLLAGQPREAAMQALARARGRFGRNPVVVEAEMDDIAASVKISSEAPGGFSALLNERNRAPLAVGCSLMLFQQITGQPSVLYYATQIFKDAGFPANNAAQISVGLGLFKLLMTGVTVFTVDKAGRRPLLLGGVSAMAAALAALAFCQWAGVSPVLSVVALLIYVGAYQLSFGPISWLIVGEVFGLGVRGQATAVASLINFGSNFGVSFALPTVQKSLGQDGTYLLFCVISIVAVASIYFTVPETKGKSLEEIETMFDEGRME
eukprot:CAMPEP_0206138946 /NCGR_PEP_ID=MMETSP1473-20131121/4000_1 /ASSEMBLY_ACC=CAM_ASM_001109 /TAXON_ID=1461547 /ORGANISM="Stichococcus sp, Strain RCC1054" /LENGTH=518 /DNA_ID=CAMNT_0053532515 /DNA_START=301 /DNA_END=1857 /DNA_ORIENTATION=+